MTADRPTSELTAVLTIERECCARLMPLLDAERSAAAAYDHAALLACLREREILQAEWLRASERRRALQKTLGPTCIAEDAELVALMREVAREAATVRRAQRINEGVVRAALAQVTDLLAVMRRERPDSRYDGRAALTGQALSSAGGSWSA
jgi:flagellar biosynthesis/type III secretory pathway chaperone